MYRELSKWFGWFFWKFMIFKKKYGNIKYLERVKYINLLFLKICVGVIGW